MTDEPRFEHDPYERDEDEDELAETQEALEEERDEIDAAASEDPHAAEREELNGLSLSWWKDTSLLSAHFEMALIFDQVLDQFDGVQALRSEGLPKEAMRRAIVLDMLSGPLIMAGLQLLGMYLPDLRPAIKGILASIPKPEATEEEEEQIAAAMSNLAETRTQQFKDDLGARLQLIDENNDAGLGLN